MKRIIAIMTAVMLLVSVLAVSASATTKADLLTEAAKSPIYKYVKVAVENAARTVTITDEQAEQLLPLVKKAVAAVATDRGPTFANHDLFYTLGEHKVVMNCIDEACAILGWTYAFEDSHDPKHPNDHVFRVHDQTGKIIFEYDGDIVADTAAATETDTTAIFVGAVSMLLAGAAAVAVSKKRIAER